MDLPMPELADGTDVGTLPVHQVAELRARVGRWLRELASRTEPALHEALARAGIAWDQADAVSILDDALQAERRELEAAWRQLATGGDAGGLAAALEALLALEASARLATLVERRLATLIRLQLSGGGELLPAGRPFLDVSAALVEAARGWA